jgi:hypothetical protein
VAQLGGGDESVAVLVEHLEGLLDLLHRRPDRSANKQAGGSRWVSQRAHKGDEWDGVCGLEWRAVFDRWATNLLGVGVLHLSCHHGLDSKGEKEGQREGERAE